MSNSSSVESLFAIKGETVSFGERFQASEQFDRVFSEGMALVERSAAYLDGEPADDRIRTARVTANVSAVSAVPVVREWVNSRLRELARAGVGLVVDGRDIGTVVFPDADLKVFLTATPEARARRRLTQRGDAVDPAVLAVETERLAARDRADSSRPVAPLRKADDAEVLDTTEMNFAEQVGRIVEWARGRLGT